MGIGEALVTYNEAVRRERAELVTSNEAVRRERAELVTLQEVAKASFADIPANAVGTVGRIKAYLEWVADPRPAFADTLDGEDKFAELIEQSRAQQDLASFYSIEVGVNPSTVWRWASGKSRPNKFVGKKLVVAVEAALRSALYVAVYDRRLARAAEADAEAADGNMVVA